MVHQQFGRSINPLKFEGKGNQLNNKIDSVINNHKSGIDNLSSERQLGKIKLEINKMIEVKSSREFTPSFPRIIVDTWDFNTGLGTELLSFFELYKKVK